MKTCVDKYLIESAVEYDPQFCNYFPKKLVRLPGDERKFLIYGQNKYTTRQFSKKFKLFINDEFGPQVSNNVYTWALIERNGNIVFLATCAYNDLEIHAKHATIISKFIDEFKYITDKKNVTRVVCAGELEKHNNTISYNFASGTFMAEREDYQEIKPNIVEVMSSVFCSLGFKHVNFVDAVRSMIPSTMIDYKAFITSMPGGVKYFVIDDETRNIIDPLRKAKLTVEVGRLKTFLDRFGNSPHVDVKKIEAQIMELEDKLRFITSVQNKYKVDGRRRMFQF